MSERPSEQQVNAFVDGELPLTEQLEMERRVAEDTALRTQVESLRALRRAVREQADYHAAPDALRARLRALTASAGALPPRPSAAPRHGGARAALQRWFAWRPLVPALGAAAVAMFALNMVVLAPARDQQVGQEVIASHVRATLAQRLVDVQSSDHHTVKPWLSSKLDFSPPVRELKGPDSAFLGGRVDYVDGRPVAALVYKRGAHVVDAYIWPSSDPDKPAVMSVQRGFRVAHWTADGMAHWVVSDLGAQEFDALVRELRTPEGS